VKLDDDLEERLRRIDGPAVDEPPMERIARRGRRRLAARLAGVAVATALVLGGLTFGTLGLAGLRRGGPVAPGAGPAGCGRVSTVLRVTVQNGRFDTTCLAVPADRPFTIRLLNLDQGQPRNVSIFHGPHPCASTHHPGNLRASTCDQGMSVFIGTMVTGRGTITYHVGPLPAGTYSFLSEALYWSMHGVLVAR
jgi:hypothetical protein